MVALLSFKTNRFHVAVGMYSTVQYRLHKMSKCGKNISDTLGCAPSAAFLFSPHFDIICDLLLNKHTAKNFDRTLNQDNYIGQPEKKKQKKTSEGANKNETQKKQPNCLKCEKTRATMVKFIGQGDISSL